MVYVLHGEEEFEKSERLAELRAGVSDDPSLIGLNVTVLDGRETNWNEIRHHCDTPPFLGEYRLVVVENFFSRGAGKSGRRARGSGAQTADAEHLLAYLPHVPETTKLAFLEEDRLPARHPLLKAAAALGDDARVERFDAPSPRGDELPRWIGRRATRRGVKLGAGVAQDLAAFIGPDLRLIDSELEKLAVYASGRVVTREDVRLLVPYAQQANIFDMVDALGHRKTREAFRLLARLRKEGAHPLYLLTMIVRQHRILLQVKELMSQGLDKNAIASTLGLHPYPTGKAMAQARRYTPAQLNRIYDRLLETDVSIKTGQMDANLALDLLVVELARL
ncbi:MAG: DNA polymerase III subunit delta [Chloroflexi bacterium]|nr:DNA polymerase III subunit delta [Chloroflexota bacterium]